MNDTAAPSTLVDVLQAAPSRNHALFLPETSERFTYAVLREQVMGAAGVLRRAGIERDCRVALALPNGRPALVGFLAASIAGTAAPLNPAYRYEEFRFYLEDTSARVLIVPPDGADAARKAAGELGVAVLTSEDLDTRGAPKPEMPNPEDIALVLHTSGSTGRPKRVPLSHANLAASVKTIADSYQLGEDDVSLCLMPMFHVHGLMASVLATLFTGGTAVIPVRFNPMSFWRTVLDEGITWYSAVPTIHQLMLMRRRPSDDHGLRFVRSCSAALSPALMKELEDHFETPILEAYGMTEAAHQIASNPLPPGDRRPGSVGPGTGVRISIRDEHGQELPSGARGEVCIQGQSVIRAYENNPEATAEGFFGEWFRTGDLGVLEEDGYLRLVGRIKEMINRGGEKIAPAEVDEVLMAHPSVAEAVTFGVPHPTWGEEVAAAVVLGGAATEEEIIAHCHEQLADFKCPKKVHVVMEIPRTVTGKVQRMNVAASFRK